MTSMVHRILIIMTSTQINQKKMRRLEKEYTTMKSKEKEVMMTVVMMAMMVTKHDSYERNASLQNAPELILARCKDVLWHRAQWKGVLLYTAQCTAQCIII